MTTKLDQLEAQADEPGIFTAFILKSDLKQMCQIMRQQNDALLGESRTQNRWSDAMIDALSAFDEFNKGE